MRFSPGKSGNIQGSYGILHQYLWMSAIPYTVNIYRKVIGIVKVFYQLPGNPSAPT